MPTGAPDRVRGSPPPLGPAERLAPEGPHLPYSRIAVCVDASEASLAALDEARRVRIACSSDLTLVHVLESPSTLVAVAAAFGGGPVTDSEVELDAARSWLQELADGVPGAGIELLRGEAAPAIQHWARETGIDLLVAARHRGAVERVLLGSFASQITRDAPCPVLLVPPAERAS